MLSPQLRNKVDTLWTLFWNAGLANPMVAIEQITYLLFIRQLEGLDRHRVRAGKPSIYGKRQDADGKEHDYEDCRWSNIRHAPSFLLLNDTVFPWLRGLERWLKDSGSANGDVLSRVTGRLNDAYFVLDPNKGDTLTRAIGLIDELFRQLDSHSVNADIMGDIFEYLLDEIQTSGTNGQFRTPRQIVRFMVQLLDPTPGTRVLDPACGTGGFLINTLLHWRANQTAADVLRLEWDGTPHEVRPVWPNNSQPDFNASLHGFDNDRTMSRIAWMNLILHDLEFPSIEQRDSLSKTFDDHGDQSGQYDFVLANPPFTGNVDEGDLCPKHQRFPRGKGESPITTKSELLFVWLILDLLKPGGRAAVIVPDGVLFGSTNAHRALRRQLLFENTLEAVVSLPGNVFQPYSGVKTSILVFQKAGQEAKPGDPPRTREVFFYEVQDEAYSLDQKRNPRPGKDNDIWDALAKFQEWKRFASGGSGSKEDAALEALRESAIAPTYWQPEYWEERWRAVDDDLLKLFPEKAADKGHTYGIHELWSDLPRDPRAAEAVAADFGRAKLEIAFARYCKAAAQAAATKARPPEREEKAVAAAEKTARDLANRLNKLVRDENLLDREFDQYGTTALRPVVDALRGKAAEWARGELASLPQTAPAVPAAPAADEELRAAALSFAHVDGYNVWRRSREVKDLGGKEQPDGKGGATRAKVQLSWAVPVREWARRDTWGADPAVGSDGPDPTHTPDGLVRPDYVAWLRDTLAAFDDDGTLKPDFADRLDPACIEALELNLSAGRHKPFTFEAGEHRPPAELIGELQTIHGKIQERLGKLKAMVEGGN